MRGFTGLGTQLEQLCSSGQHHIVLTAPFIKAPTLARLLDKVPDSARVQCITRWRPEEIVAGVSDLEVWPLIQKRDQTSLWLRHDLHAKYYRADTKCMIGSANITDAALGWTRQPNLELLIELPYGEQFVQFEMSLLSRCIQVDQQIYEQIKEITQGLKEQGVINISPAQDVLELSFAVANVSLGDIDCWTPRLRHPEDLYLAYIGRLDRLSTASQQAALGDLASLPVPMGLDRKMFEGYIAMLLLQLPVIRQIDVFVEQPQKFVAVREFLGNLDCFKSPDFDAERAWQTLMRWLLYFLPKRYSLSQPINLEVFLKIGSN